MAPRWDESTVISVAYDLCVPWRCAGVVEGAEGGF